MKTQVRTSICAVLAMLAVSPAVFSGQDAKKAEEKKESRVALASDPTTASKGVPSLGAGMAVLDKAASLRKYAFIFFYRSDDGPTQQMRKVFDAAMGNLADRAEPVAIRVTDVAERPIVNKFKVGSAPMPFVFSVAPNGAVIRSYRTAFTEQQLASAFASPGLEKTLKSLQDGKMTFLCIQNDKTKHDAEAMKGVNDFKSDPKYAKTTEVVTIDPSDAAEAQFLQNLKVDPNTPEAVTVLLAPPGKIVGTFEGGTDKTVLLTSVNNTTKKKPCCAGKKGGCKKPAKKKG
jgi:hypothetical protein